MVSLAPRGSLSDLRPLIETCQPLGVYSTLWIQARRMPDPFRPPAPSHLLKHRPCPNPRSRRPRCMQLDQRTHPRHRRMAKSIITRSITLLRPTRSCRPLRWRSNPSKTQRGRDQRAPLAVAMRATDSASGGARTLLGERKRSLTGLHRAEQSDVSEGRSDDKFEQPAVGLMREATADAQIEVEVAKIMVDHGENRLAVAVPCIRTT